MWPGVVGVVGGVGVVGVGGGVGVPVRQKLLGLASTPAGFAPMVTVMGLPISTVPRESFDSLRLYVDCQTKSGDDILIAFALPDLLVDIIR